MANTRWSEFRTSSESMPTHPYEAAVFLQNARLHVITVEPNNWEARKMLMNAHEEVNKHFFDEQAVSE